jgi:regulator of RNase E activity RraA
MTPEELAARQNALRALRRFDGGALANAVETFNVRLRNEGFTDSRIRALFETLPPVAGHAVTARIRCSTPPPVGDSYLDRTDWWSYIVSVPPPRIVIVEDVDERPGLGAFLGHVHAEILRSLGCAAYVTNGSVRDVSGVRASGLQIFAGGLSPSHAFVHIVDFGEPSTVAGVTFASGDIVYGDVHGLLVVPPAILDAIPAAAERLLARDQQVVDFCRSSGFALEDLRNLVRSLA